MLSYSAFIIQSVPHYKRFGGGTYSAAGGDRGKGIVPIMDPLEKSNRLGRLFGVRRSMLLWSTASVISVGVLIFALLVVTGSFDEKIIPNRVAGSSASTLAPSAEDPAQVVPAASIVAPPGSSVVEFAPAPEADGAPSSAQDPSNILRADVTTDTHSRISGAQMPGAATTGSTTGPASGVAPALAATSIPDTSPLQALPTTVPMASLALGSTSGAPGCQVRLPIYLNTAGKTIRGVRVNLAYDGQALTEAMGTAGTDLPATWIFASHSPASGELRFLAIDPTGYGQPFNGPVFTALFTVDSGAPEGDVTVTVTLQEVRDDANLELNLTVTDSAVTVSPRVGGVQGQAGSNKSIGASTIPSR